MHIININLHNYQNTWNINIQISRAYSLWHVLHKCQISWFFGAPRLRSEGGGPFRPPPSLSSLQNTPVFLGLNLLTQKCICGKTVTVHVAENKRRRAWQKNRKTLFQRLLECLAIWFKIISGILVIYCILHLLEPSDYLQTC